MVSVLVFFDFFVKFLYFFTIFGFVWTTLPIFCLFVKHGAFPQESCFIIFRFSPTWPPRFTLIKFHDCSCRCTLSKKLHHLCVKFCVSLFSLCFLRLPNLLSSVRTCTFARFSLCVCYRTLNSFFRQIYKSIDIRLYLPWSAPLGVVFFELSPRSFLCIVTTMLIASFHNFVFIFTHFWIP